MEVDLIRFNGGVGASKTGVLIVCGGIDLTGLLADGRFAGFRLLVLAIEVFLTNDFRAFDASR